MMIFHEIKFEWDIRQPSAEYSETQIESPDVVHLPFGLLEIFFLKKLFDLRLGWFQSYNFTKYSIFSSMNHQTMIELSE